MAKLCLFVALNEEDQFIEAKNICLNSKFVVELCLQYNSCFPFITVLWVLFSVQLNEKEATFQFQYLNLNVQFSGGAKEKREKGLNSLQDDSRKKN